MTFWIALTALLLLLAVYGLEGLAIRLEATVWAVWNCGHKLRTTDGPKDIPILVTLLFLRHHVWGVYRATAVTRLLTDIRRGGCRDG